MPPTNTAASTVKVFVHIPKAAGTTLVSIIEQEYSARSRYRFRQSHPITEQVADINQAAVAPHPYRIVTGHIGYGLHTELKQPVSYFTMLREPLSLLISRYYYRQQHPRQDDPLVRHANRSSLLEFANSIEDNTLTRFLSGAEFQSQQSLGPEQSSFLQLQTARVVDETFAADLPCTPEMLETAKANLRDRFDGFGLTERFDESIVMFSHVFGWRKIHYLKKNVGKTSSQKPTVPDEVKAQIKARNCHDMELYAYACDLFDQRIADMGADFHNTLERFQAMNPLYGRINTWQAAIAQTPKTTVRTLRQLKKKITS